MEHKAEGKLGGWSAQLKEFKDGEEATKPLRRKPYPKVGRRCCLDKIGRA